MTFREEIIDILKDVYYNNDQADPFDENDADRILKLFEKRIDSRIQDIKQNPYAERDEVIAELEDFRREILIK